MLVDAPFAPILREWQWSSPSGTTALFWLLALVAAGVLALRRCRTRLTFYELAVLVVTFVGAVQAVRGVIWFALAAAAILPVALDGLLTKEDVAAPQAQPDHLARRARRPRGRRARVRRAPRVVVRVRVARGPRRRRARGDPRPERPRLGDRRHRRLAPLAHPRPPRPPRLRRPLRALRPADPRPDRRPTAPRGGLESRRSTATASSSSTTPPILRRSPPSPARVLRTAGTISWSSDAADRLRQVWASAGAGWGDDVTAVQVSSSRVARSRVSCPTRISSRVVKLAGLQTVTCEAGWRPWLFVKPTTDVRLVGWSEVTDSHGSPTGLAGVVTDLAFLVARKDPRAGRRR